MSVIGRGPQGTASTGVKPALLSAGPQANPGFQKHDPQRGNEQTLALVACMLMSPTGTKSPFPGQTSVLLSGKQMAILCGGQTGALPVCFRASV